MVGLVFAMVFAYSQPLMRSIVAFLLVVWAALAPLMLSWTVLDLASWSFACGDYRRARSLSLFGSRLDEWLKPAVALIGMSESPFGVYNSLNHASSCQALGLYNEADGILKSLLERIETSDLDADAGAAPRVLSALALNKQLLGDFDGAEATLRRSLLLKEGRLGRDEMDEEEKNALKLVTACDLNQLGRLECKRLNLDSAEDNLKLSIERLESIPGIDPEREIWSEFASGMVELLIARGKFDLACELALSVLNVRRRNLNARHPALAAALDSYGRSLALARDYQKAGVTLEEARRIKAKSRDVNPADQAETLLGLALVAAGRGEVQAAEALFSETLRLKEAAFGPVYPDIAEVLEAQSDFLEAQGRADEAVPMRARAGEIRHKYALHNY